MAGGRMKLEINGTRRPREDTSHDRLSVLRDAHRTLIALADGVDSARQAQVAAARAVLRASQARARAQALAAEPTTADTADTAETCDLARCCIEWK